MLIRGDQRLGKISPVLPSVMPRSVTWGPGLHATLAPTMALKVRIGGCQSMISSAAAREGGVDRQGAAREFSRSEWEIFDVGDNAGSAQLA
jgi:hypothetical protein